MLSPKPKPKPIPSTNPNPYPNPNPNPYPNPNLQALQSEREVIGAKLTELGKEALVAAEEVQHYKTEYDESLEQARRSSSPSYHPCRRDTPPPCRTRGGFVT